MEESFSKKIRLGKLLAERGVASRRASEKLVFEGKVKVNGKTILLPGTLVDPLKDKVSVEGVSLPKQCKKIYFLLNKPPGYLCTNVREGKKKIVLDLFPPLPFHLFYVGRLDKDSCGLLLVTNDGGFAHKVIHPSFGKEKEYLVQVKEEPTFEKVKRIREGAFVENKWRKPLRVEKVRKHTLRIIVQEGKKHEVRLFVGKAYLTIKELKRVRIGSLLLGKLPSGSFRELTEKEKKLLLEESEPSSRKSKPLVFKDL